jgi:hypothetical protein
MSKVDQPDGEPAHDVLAAEEFAMPAPDPDLHHGPVLLPEDPTGTPEPHDVLAAEEFPMPAPRRAEVSDGRALVEGGIGGAWATSLAVAAGGLLLARRLLRR